MRIRELLSESSLAGGQGDVIEYKGGEIDIHTAPSHAPRSQSVINFNVPEESRNLGIGDTLVKMALKKYHDLGAQVSSLSSLKVFYNNGFRNPDIPGASFEEHASVFQDQGGSLFMARNDADGNPY